MRWRQPMMPGEARCRRADSERLLARSEGLSVLIPGLWQSAVFARRSQGRTVQPEDAR